MRDMGFLESWNGKIKFMISNMRKTVHLQIDIRFPKKMLIDMRVLNGFFWMFFNMAGYLLICSQKKFYGLRILRYYLLILVGFVFFLLNFLDLSIYDDGSVNGGNDVVNTWFVQNPQLSEFGSLF